ncbi:hypothetical protein HYS48_04125 [Candidatus Woesearchaeota archaeon]|nr:hypothetical protein [Candidatus Woesearchaeota archaeon]
MQPKGAKGMQEKDWLFPLSLVILFFFLGSFAILQYIFPDTLSGKAGHLPPNMGEIHLTVVADCADGQDNDGDGKADYPADCGCINPEDDTEDSSCPNRCGNNIIDPGEECDGGNLNGKNCRILEFDGGDLACKAECLFNTDGCIGAPKDGDEEDEDEEGDDRTEQETQEDTEETGSGKKVRGGYAGGKSKKKAPDMAVVPGSSQLAEGVVAPETEEEKPAEEEPKEPGIPWWVPLIVALPLLFLLGYSILAHEGVLWNLLQNIGTGILLYPFIRTRIADRDLLLLLVQDRKIQRYRKLLVDEEDFAMFHEQYKNLKLLNKKLKQRDVEQMGRFMKQHHLSYRFAKLLMMAKHTIHPILHTEEILPGEVLRELRPMKFINPFAKEYLQHFKHNPRYEMLQNYFLRQRTKGISYPKIANELEKAGWSLQMIQAVYEGEK